MVKNVYSIFDSAADLYLHPFYAKADGEALRVFYDVSIGADSEVAKHPEDYSLFRVAEWNDNRGEFVPLEKVCLATALEMVSKAQNKGGPQLSLVGDE